MTIKREALSPNNKIKKRKLKEEKEIYPKLFTEVNVVDIPHTNKTIEDVQSSTQLAKLAEEYPSLYEFFHSAISAESEESEQDKVSQEEFIKSIQSISLDVNTPSFIDEIVQKQLLQKLGKDVPIPIYNKEIRPELFGMFPHFITDNLVEILKKEPIEKFNIELLLGISGSGKTFKLHAKSVYHNYFLIYMICTPPVLTKSHGDGIDFSNCEDFTEVTDPGYQLLLKRIGNYSNFVTRHVYVDCECQIFLMSRLLYLLMLIKKHNGDLTPSLFLQYQVNGSLANIKIIYKELIKLFEPSDYSTEYLLKINSKLLDEIYLLTGKKVGFALDEMNSIDQTLLKLNFLSKSSNKFCSFTNYFLVNIVSLGQSNDKMFYLGVSGTNFDMGSCERYLSSLYKDTRLNIFEGKVDSIKSKEEINSFFSKFLNIDDSSYQEVINSPYLVKLMIGRKRMLAPIIAKLGDQRDFKGSVIYVYEGMCKSLMDNLKIKLITIPKRFWLGICNLFLVSFLSKGVQNFEEPAPYTVRQLDWIPTGLCIVETFEDNKKYLVTISDEMFVSETLLRFIKIYREDFIRQFLNFISNTPQLFQPQPFGTIFELIIMLNLIANQTFTINDFSKCKTIDDFDDEQNILFLPADAIEISRFGTCGDFGFLTMRSYLQEGLQLAKLINEKPNIDHSYSISKLCGKLVKPPDDFHPDYFTFQYCKRLKRLFIVEFSLKCSDNQTIATATDDFLKSIFQLRTDMYFGNNYTPQSGFKPNAKYQDLLDELMQIPSVKIHIIFPGFTDYETVVDYSSTSNLKQEVLEFVLNKGGCLKSRLLSRSSLDYIEKRSKKEDNMDNNKIVVRVAENVKNVHTNHIYNYSTINLLNWHKRKKKKTNKLVPILPDIPEKRNLNK